MLSLLGLIGPPLFTAMTIERNLKSTLRPVELKCESVRAPIGVDARNPRLSWVLNGSGDQRNLTQQSYRILVASSKSMLTKNVADMWDSGQVQSSEQNNIRYLGRPLRSGQTCFWKVQVKDQASKTSDWSAVSHWEMGLLNASDWQGHWVNDGKPNPRANVDFYKNEPAPLFRKQIRLGRAIKRGRLYISGLGYYEASLNGHKVGDHVLDPGWTNYSKRVFYSSYDVTDLVTSGENCIGVMLGNGWYNPLPMKMWGNLNLRDHLTVGRPRFIAQLRIDYQDGTKEIIASDRSWKVGEGPILRNSVYLGEVYDARKEQPGWNKPGFDDEDWRASAVASEKVGALISQPQPPIRIHSEWHAVKATQPKLGVFLYDFGRNLAGWVRLKLAVQAKTSVQLRYGELQNQDGTLNPMTSVAGQIKSRGVGGEGAPDIAWQTDTYIAKGGVEETYQPRFTFHGFRFVEVTGLKEMLSLDSVTALQLYSDVDAAGEFSCSNLMLNQVQQMCRNTFLSNIFSVQSDCPHREKMGYGGDIGATSEAFISNFDMSTFYAKAVQDWADSAFPDGMFTDTAPFMGIQYCGVGWAIAHPLLTTQLLRYYGNRQLVADQYEPAKRWLLLVEKQWPEGIVRDGLSDHEGLAPAPTPEMVTPLYFKSAKLLASMAHQLKKTTDEAYFTRLADKIQKAYLDKFVDQETGKVGPGTQASQAFGLETGIIPDHIRAKVLDFLLSDIAQHNNHLTTGIYGTKFMLDLLSREGNSDVAYRIVTQPDFPGWGWMLRNGATTLWEHWEYSDNTFSHNHPMFGSVSQWLMNWLGGIQADPEAIGYDRIVIRPQAIDGLDWVKSSHMCIRGKIESNWSRKGEKLIFEIAIPVNTTACVYLPAGSISQVSEGGKLILGAKFERNSVCLTIGSGRYTFVVSS